MAILESLPPPFGGVTIHVDRLTRILAEAGIPYRLYDMQKRSIPQRHVVPGGKSPLWILKFLLTFPEAALHLHVARPSVLVPTFMLLAPRKRRLVVSFHRDRAMLWYRGAGPMRRAVYRWVMRRAAHSFSANPEITNWLSAIGVAPQRVSTVAPFIPPTRAEQDPAALPQAIRDFLAAHSPVVGTHGWFGYFRQGVHVYSFDMILRLIQSVRRRYPRAGFYTFISGVYDEGHRREVLRARNQAGLDDHWMILQGLDSSVALYARSDLFVRPTTTDGDSVSVRECLYLGVPVVASDSVPRPSGCVLFTSRDQAAMEEAVEDVLRDLEGHRRRVLRERPPDTSELILRAYRQVLAECR